MNADDRRPALSIVIVRFALGDAIDATLRAIEPQGRELSIEVLCVSAGERAVAVEWRQRYPAVRWIEAPAHATPARLRTLGVAASTGELVACTEDHCVPAPDWCARIVAAHVAGNVVVGGAIEKGAPVGTSTTGTAASGPESAGPSAWVAYLLDYSRYMPPFPAGPAEYVSDCNVSYRRAMLDAVADVWREEFHETTVHRALVQRGVTLRLDPSVLVSQERTIALSSYLLERTQHGRLFAAARVRGASRIARLKWMMGSLFLPPVIVLRVVARLRRKGRLGAVPAGAWLPLACAAVAWSYGELKGYVTGRGA